MTKETKVKLDNYLKTRGLFFFVIFLTINILAYLNIINLFIDIISHFRLQYLLISIIFFIIFIYVTFSDKRFITAILASILLIGMNFYGIHNYIGKKMFANSEQNIKLGLFNVLTQNKNYEKFLNEVKTHNPDIIILQEVDDSWLENIKELKSEYSYNNKLPRDDNFGIALFSKVPLKFCLIEFWTDLDIPVIHAMTTNDIEIYGIHTLPPTGEKYFQIRNEMLEKISTLNRNKNTKLIISGDLNTTIYSPAYRKYIKSVELNDAQIFSKNIKGTWNSAHFPIFRIPLEHILFSKNLKLNNFSIGKNFGSDHLPVFAEIGL